MAGNDSTAGSTTPDRNSELSDVQARLLRMMSSGDDRTKRQIFNQVICLMTDALPALPPEAASEKTEPVAVRTRDLLDASDKLREACYLAEFIQTISLNGPRDSAVTLQPGQLTGFYFAMQNTIDRIREAEALIDAVRNPSEVLSTTTAA